MSVTITTPTIYGPSADTVTRKGGIFKISAFGELEYFSRQQQQIDFSSLSGLVELAQLGTTIIDGGYIKTSLIDVETLLADVILVGDLGDLAELDTVELTNLGTTVISGGYLKNDLIDTGTLLADVVAVGDLGDLAELDTVELTNLGTTIISGGYIKTSLLNTDVLVVGSTATNQIISDLEALNAWTENSVTYIRKVVGGSYSINSAVTGAIKVRLPQLRTNTMLKFKIDVFNYSTNTSFTLLVSGYNYSTGWVNCSTQLIGNSAGDNAVRFGNDGVKDCIWIGNTTSSWSHLKVNVYDFQAGYLNYTIAQWETGWSVSVSTVIGAVDVTFSDNLVDAQSTKYIGSNLATDIESYSLNPASRINTQATTISGGKITTGSINTVQINGHAVTDVASAIYAGTLISVTRTLLATITVSVLVDTSVVLFISGKMSTYSGSGTVVYTGQFETYCPTTDEWLELKYQDETHLLSQLVHSPGVSGNVVYYLYGTPDRRADYTCFTAWVQDYGLTGISCKR